MSGYDLFTARYYSLTHQASQHHKGLRVSYYDTKKKKKKKKKTRTMKKKKIVENKEKKKLWKAVHFLFCHEFCNEGEGHVKV